MDVSQAATTTTPLDAEFQQSMTELFQTLGLDGWKIEFVAGKSQAFGRCHGPRKTLYFYTEPMSYLTLVEQKDVVLHEIAHALVGVRHGHDAVWRRMARTLGATPRARALQIKDTSYYRYVGICPQDPTHVYPRQRFLQKYRAARCSRCMVALRWMEGEKVLYDPAA